MRLGGGSAGRPPLYFGGSGDRGGAENMLRGGGGVDDPRSPEKVPRSPLPLPSLSSIRAANDVTTNPVQSPKDNSL